MRQIRQSGLLKPHRLEHLRLNWNLRRVIDWVSELVLNFCESGLNVLQFLEHVVTLRLQKLDPFIRVLEKLEYLLVLNWLVSLLWLLEIQCGFSDLLDEIFFACQ